MARIEVVPRGTRWPETDYVSAALIPIAPRRLAELVGGPLVDGIEDGLGSWEAIGLRLESGVLVELIRYQSKPEPQGFVLRIAGDANISAALTEVIAVLGMSRDSLTWVSPRVSA